jgi:hypothetical protein
MSLPFKADIDSAMKNFVPEDRTAIYIPVFPDGSEDAFKKLSYYNHGDKFLATIIRAVPREDFLDILKEIVDESGYYDIIPYWKNQYGMCSLFEHLEGTQWYLKISRKGSNIRAAS